MADITTQSVESLHAELGTKRESLREARFGAAGSRSRNVRAVRETRKEIARIMTELRKREIASETE